MKRQPTEWGKIFPNFTSDRGLIPIIIHIKNSHNSIAKKKKCLIKTGRRGVGAMAQ